MIGAIAVASSLGALWALLLLMTIVRLRDPLGHLHYRELVFDTYRQQNERLQMITCAICLGEFLVVFLAVIHGHVWLLLPSTAVAVYLMIGIMRVLRNIDGMRFKAQDVDPCWQALALALGWPAWAVQGSGTATR